MHMCVKECVEGRAIEDNGVMLWHLWLLCKSHHKHKWVLALTSFHITHHSQMADVLQHYVLSHTMSFHFVGDEHNSVLSKDGCCLWC